MKRLARVTGVILVVIGLLVVGVGLYMASRAFWQPAPFLPSMFGSAEAEGTLLPLRLLVGGIIGLQGLMTAAVGEGLWLVARMAEHSQKTSEYLGSWLGKGALRIP